MSSNIILSPTKDCWLNYYATKKRWNIHIERYSRSGLHLYKDKMLESKHRRLIRNYLQLMMIFHGPTEFEAQFALPLKERNSNYAWLRKHRWWLRWLQMNITPRRCENRTNVSEQTKAERGGVVQSVNNSRSSAIVCWCGNDVAPLADIMKGICCYRENWC